LHSPAAISGPMIDLVVIAAILAGTISERRERLPS
jgi:hypothetical protein